MNLKNNLEELETLKNEIYTYIESLEIVYDQFSVTFGELEIGIDLNTSEDEEDNNLALENGSNGIFSNIFSNKKKNKKLIKKSNSVSKDGKLLECKNCLNIDKIKKIDFISQKIGFRQSASGLLSTMNHCIDEINKANSVLLKKLKIVILLKQTM